MKTKTITKRLSKSLQTINKFLFQTVNNYKKMRTRLIEIWACITLCLICSCLKSCNVTRVVSNESTYYQKGDTAVTIQTKTTETYNAKKNLY